jgi:carbon monoxide dehydrogenase subunit G
MRIEKNVVVQAPAEAVWAFLTDPRRVASCLPGAAITDQIDPQSWGGTMTVKVGPVTANYRGRMKFERLDAAAREAEIAASGQETRGKGGADMRMSSRVIERGPTETEVVIVSDVNVVGVLAQFGRGMIEDVSDQMFGKFSAAMRRQLEAAPAATTTAAAPAPTPAIPAGTETPMAGAEPALPTAPASSAAPATLDAAPVGRAPRPPSGSASTAPSAGATAASPAPAATATPPRESEEVLDLGAIGTAAAGRAAGRLLRNPVFWIVVAILVAASWYLLR